MGIGCCACADRHKPSKEGLDDNSTKQSKEAFKDLLATAQERSDRKELLLYFFALECNTNLEGRMPTQSRESRRTRMTPG